MWDHHVVVVLGLTSLLTFQVISVAFYSKREKSDNFCSEALISAWGSFTCHKSMTRDSQLYFPSEGSHTQVFTLWKNPSTPAGFEPSNLGSSGEYDNHGTTRVDFGWSTSLIYIYIYIYLNTDKSVRMNQADKITALSLKSYPTRN